MASLAAWLALPPGSDPTSADLAAACASPLPNNFSPASLMNDISPMAVTPDFLLTKAQSKYAAAANGGERPAIVSRIRIAVAFRRRAGCRERAAVRIGCLAAPICAQAHLNSTRATQ